MVSRQDNFESTFKSYRKVASIGSGGSGTVVKVQDDNTLFFAIKYLSPDYLSTEKIKRFQNELAFCAKNEHPNIIKVLDWGYIIVKGRKCPFYVMPYYEKNLRDLLKTGIPTGKILPYFSQILNGVEAAHLQDVWHRDLKPENILFDPQNNTVVIADFGIARFAEPMLQTLVETKPRSRLANFQYAAPEQRERGHEVDGRADIFALGLILNEMFTGKLAHGVGFSRIIQADNQYEYLDELIDLMLSQSPDQRPISISDVKRELIARENDFFIQQKLSQLQRKVIPDTEIDDPLIIDPPYLINAKWENGWLIMTLSQNVNSNWVDCFHNPGSHSYAMGKGPQTFQIQGNVAKIHSDGTDANVLIRLTIQYLQMANKKYKTFLEKSTREKKEKEEAELKRRVELTEKTRKINKKLKI